MEKSSQLEPEQIKNLYKFSAIVQSLCFILKKNQVNSALFQKYNFVKFSITLFVEHIGYHKTNNLILKNNLKGCIGKNFFVLFEF